MKKLILLSAMLIGTAYAQQTYVNPYGTPTVVQQGQTTVYTDRSGTPVVTAIQQPQYEPRQYPYYTPSNPSPYTPDSIVQDQRAQQYNQYNR